MSAIRSRDGASNQAPPPAPARTAALALAALVGAMLGLAAYTFNYAEGLSYLSNDPSACVNCHVMRENFDGWQKATHHAVATCNDCHVPQDLIGKYVTKAEHGYRHSKGFTLQDFHEPIRMKPSSRAIVVDNCRRCHEALVDQIAGDASYPAHAATLDCIHCHARVGHGPTR